MDHSIFEENILTPIFYNLTENANLPAFLIDGVEYSYRQFGERIYAIRQCIHQRSSSEVSSQKQIYAIAIHDDLDTYASIIALWMEGCAYVPLHPNQPIERNLNIIHQVGTDYIIDSSQQSVFDKELNNQRTEIIHTNEIKWCSDHFLNQWNSVGDEELAYILFTSGSTGTPKGVCLTRKNIATFIDSFWKTGITIDTTDRCLQAFDLTFDVSIQSFLTGLIRGACVCTIPYGQVKYLHAASLIMEQGITFAAMAPSMLTYLRPYFDEIKADQLKTCILTAEACPVDLIEDWYKCATNTEIYDFYGPTEGTIYCTYYKLNRNGNNLSANGIISIGKPLDNVTAIIIDEKGNILNTDEKGELCIAGDQITKGYWNNPEKNNTSFFEKEIKGSLVRFYHTGDLCNWDASGNIIYLGRIDQKAKIQGFRVELGEIEYHTRTFFNNKNRAVAITYTNNRGLDEIALFIESEPIDSCELTKYLQSKMPNYMIPSQLHFLSDFPLNNSDKIDRNKLKQLLSK